MMTPWPRSWKQVLWLMSGTYGRKTTEEKKNAFSSQDKIIWNYESESVSCSVMSDSLPPHGLARQATLSIEFSRQEYRSGLPFSSPGDLPNPGIQPMSSASQTDSLPFELPGKPIKLWMCININGLPWFLSFKESSCQCGGGGFYPWVRKTPWIRKWPPTPVFLPRNSHGPRSLEGYSPWAHKSQIQLRD